MSRPQKYATPAARQAAHRLRKEAKEGELLTALYRLETALWEAGDRGDALALACRSGSLQSMLERLKVAFEARPNTAG
jgi:hypothetical protein